MKLKSAMKIVGAVAGILVADKVLAGAPSQIAEVVVVVAALFAQSPKGEESR